MRQITEDRFLELLSAHASLASLSRGAGDFRSK